jgi:hypothetical protein
MAFPDNRPAGYNPNLRYNASDEVWQASLDLEDSGGGKNVDRIVVIGHNLAGNMVVYFN